MPTLASVSIPALSRSPSSQKNYENIRRSSQDPPSTRRTYGDEPLPYRPSNIAPINGSIASRELDDDKGALYVVKLGEVEIHDVGIDEILDYVSAQHLEEYENRDFEEWRELERIAEIEKERREEERQARRKERAKTKGTVILQDRTEFPDGSARRRGGEANDGSGRARPTYRHMFKVHKERRRRKRDPRTGELMPLSVEDEEVEDIAASDSSQDDLPVRHQSAALQSGLEPPKRRRRKRDPATGELMPLSPRKQPPGTLQTQGVHTKAKRRRRKRHPTTGELMPIGWRYNPEAVSPAMKRLDLSQEPAAKRARVSEHSSATSDSPSHPQLDEELVSESETSEETNEATALQRFQIHKGPRLPGMMDGIVEGRPVFRERNTMTSMLSPNAKLTGRHDTSEDEEDTGEEGEFTIEAILAHQLSDPKTHAAGLGTRPILLYQVKWEGFDELTWEPAGSFSDPSVLEDYQRSAGLLRDDENVDSDIDEV